MPGSHNNLADCNMILNTAVAKSLKNFSDAVEGAEDFRTAASDYIRQTLSDHQRIIFNGNGYSEEGTQEAARRGLANNKTTASALPCYVAPKSIELFEEFDVLSEAEVRSRYEIKLGIYSKRINIETRVMRRMARRTFLPAINRYASEVADSLIKYRALNPEGKAPSTERLYAKLMESIEEITAALHKLDESAVAATEIEDEQAKADYYANVVVPDMETLRAAVDFCETITDRNYWPVPSYNNMLFYV